MKQTSTVKFDPTVEAHIRLGVDPRHADQMVRGTVVLPHGTGKVVRVAVFAQGDKAQEALRAGADEVGGEDLVKKIEAGWLEFDVALATPDMMGQVGRLGKILGRRGLMPNPKAGTITFDLGRAIREVKGGRVEFKVDKGAIIHVPVGKASFEPEQLVENLATLVDAVNRAKPSRRQGPVPADADDRQHDGPGHPGRYPGRPREPRRHSARAARLAADRPLSSTTPSGVRPGGRSDGSARDRMRARAVDCHGAAPGAVGPDRATSAGTPTSMPRQESTHLVVGRAPCTWARQCRGAAPTAARRPRATHRRGDDTACPPRPSARPSTS